jgi:uncharacterized protein YjiS (DUF1127 family)
MKAPIRFVGRGPARRRRSTMNRESILSPFAEEAAARVAAWYKRQRARRSLARMSDRLLADLGLERETLRARLAAAEIEAAAARAAARAARRRSARPAESAGEEAVPSAA